MCVGAPVSTTTGYQPVYFGCENIKLLFQSRNGHIGRCMQLRAMKIAKESGAVTSKPKPAAPTRADQPPRQHQQAAAGGGRRRHAPIHFDEYDAEDQYLYTDGYKPRRSRTSVGAIQDSIFVFIFKLVFS